MASIKKSKYFFGHLMPKSSNTAKEAHRAEWIAQRIRDAILEHRLPPATKLTEAALCEVFDVKRGAIRQVLAMLQQEKIVTIEPNRGAFVASPSLREVHEIFEMRRIVEGAAVERICHASHKSGLREIAGMIVRERDAYLTRDFPVWIRLSGEFHVRLAEMTGNTVLLECLAGLVTRSTLISALYESLGRSPCSFDEHEEILRAVEIGDAARAVALMKRHLESCELKMLDRPAEQAVDLADVLAAGR